MYKAIDRRARRTKRAQKTRMAIRRGTTPRLSVYRSARHIYAQVLTPDGSSILAVASTLEKDLRSQKFASKVEAAQGVGTLIAERARAQNVEQVAFDRGGYKYHGRVKALAEAARGAGLNF